MARIVKWTKEQGFGYIDHPEHGELLFDFEACDFEPEVGDEVVVQARDDFGVAEVRVEIRDEAEALLEGGPAAETPPSSGRWVYRASTSVAEGTKVQVTAIAVDRPGNTATQTVAGMS